MPFAIGLDGAVKSDGGKHGAALCQGEGVAGAMGAQVEAGERALVAGSRVAHPAFDVTPHPLVSAIITEKGEVRGRYVKTLPAFFR